MQSSSDPLSLPYKSCRDDEIQSLCRSIVSVVHAHQRHSLQSKNLIEAVRSLHKKLIKVTERCGRVVLHFSTHALSLNGTPTLPILSSAQHDELIRLFARISIRSLSFSERSTLRDLSRLFVFLFEHHCPASALPSYPKMAAQLPSLNLTPFHPEASASSPPKSTLASFPDSKPARHPLESQTNIVEQMVEFDTKRSQAYLESYDKTASFGEQEPLTLTFSKRESSPLSRNQNTEQAQDSTQLYHSQQEHTPQRVTASSQKSSEKLHKSSHGHNSRAPESAPHQLTRPSSGSPPPKTTQHSAESEAIPLNHSDVSPHLPPDTLARWFEESRTYQTGDTIEWLAKHSSQSLPFGLAELKNIKLPSMREAHVAVCLQLLEFASPKERKRGFRQALSQLHSLNDMEVQEFCLSMCRQYEPALLESYLIKSLSVITHKELRARLFQQAIACDTPQLRQMLLQQLQANALAQDPDQEEWFLGYLHRTQTINALAFLQQRILNMSTPLNIRHSSIWMLGAFPSASSLKLLKSILTSSCPEGLVIEQWESLQFQAVHTLSRYPHKDAIPLLLNKKNKLPKFIKAHIRNILPLASLQEAALQQSQSQPKAPRVRLRQLLVIALTLALGVWGILTLRG